MEQSSSFQSKPEIENHYLAQTRTFVRRYFEEHHLTEEMVRGMPKEQSSQIYKLALKYAADQIARLDAMIRLGQQDGDGDTRPDQEPKKKYGKRDRYSHTF